MKCQSQICIFSHSHWFVKFLRASIAVNFIFRSLFCTEHRSIQVKDTHRFFSFIIFICFFFVLELFVLFGRFFRIFFGVFQNIDFFFSIYWNFINLMKYLAILNLDLILRRKLYHSIHLSFKSCSFFF